MSETIGMIEAQQVTFSYDDETPALRGVSLDIADGEFVCILGANGSGKSTFAKHLNALLTPDEGIVRVGGLDTADPAYVYDIRSNVGMVFQNPDDQLVATLVEDDVAFGPENLGMSSEQIVEHVRRALKAVGLAGFERRETHALSGGQKQRVALAGALAMEPRVLVLDEASAMLDPRGRAALMHICRKLHERGMGIVMITHFMEEAAEADRVVVFEGGHVTLEGTPAEVFAHGEELMRMNLDVPAAYRLGAALGKHGLHISAHVREDELCAAVADAYRGEKSDWGADGAATSSKAVAEDACKNASGEGFGSDQTSTPERGYAPDGVSAPAGASDSTDALDPADTVIEFSHVSYSYSFTPRELKRMRRRAEHRGASDVQAMGDTGVWALRDVSLTVKRGEFLGLAGHTGSGKSTLVQHMNGLVHPLEGCVTAFGRDLAVPAAASAVKAKVGVVFQYPERQLFAQTVAEDVAFGPRNLGLAEDEVTRRVEAALKRVGLDYAEVGEKSPFALSGGQQRRVAFAGVLAMEPEVLVLDEPAAGLDPAAHRAFLDFVDGLHDDGLTVVMVSHSMDDLARYCDRVVVMNAGAVLADGSPQEVFLHPSELEKVGLGVPAAQRMAYGLARIGVPVPLDRLYTIDALADELARLLLQGPPVDKAGF